MTLLSRQVLEPCWPAPATPADRVRILVDGPEMTSETLGLPPVDVAPGWPAKLLVTSIELDDAELVVHAGSVPFEVSRAASQSGRDFSPFPGIAGAHLLIRTSCGRLLATQRSASTSFFPSAWSLTCEEQFDLGADVTLADVVTRACYEELCVPANMVASSVVVSAGIEHDIRQDPPERLGVAFICLVELACSWPELAVLAPNAADAHEHQQIAAIEPCDSSRLLSAFVGTSSPYELCDSLELGVDSLLLVDKPSPDAGWHPTAHARLSAAASIW